MVVCECAVLAASVAARQGASSSPSRSWMVYNLMQSSVGVGVFVTLNNCCPAKIRGLPISPFDPASRRLTRSRIDPKRDVCGCEQQNDRPRHQEANLLLA